jgi:hypothetical protein
MWKAFISCVLAISMSALTGCAVQTQILTAAAKSLAEMTFDPGAPVTIHGTVGTLVWPEGTSGMLVVEAAGSGEKYAFSTAGVPAMARQGFSRFTMKPGEDVIVTGVRAKGDSKIGPGFRAARADMVTTSNGNLIFDRSKL